MAASESAGGRGPAADSNVRYDICRPQVLEELIDDELVVINFDTGRYHGIRGAGVATWKLLDAGYSVGEAMARLAVRYRGMDERAAEAVLRFVSELEHQRLIVRAPKEAPRAEVMDELRVPQAEFVAPEIDSREDLADYLALDPIHDVDERGWPNARR